MGRQSFSSFGGPAEHDRAGHQTSAGALEAFLDGLTERLNGLPDASSLFAPLQDFFTRLSDRLHDLRTGDTAPEPLDLGGDEQQPDDQAPQQNAAEADDGDTDALDDHSAEAPGAPDAEDDQDDDDGQQGFLPSEFARTTQDHGGGHGHELAFFFRDFAEPQNDHHENGPELLQAFAHEFAAFLQDAGNADLAGLLAMLPGNPGDDDSQGGLLGALPDRARELIQSHETVGMNDPSHGLHLWDNLL